MNPFTLIFSALSLVLNILQLAIFLSVLMSWIPQAKGTKFASILAMLTEPVLAPIRQLLNKALEGKNIMIDFSPIVAILLIGFIQNIIKSFAR